MRGGRDDGVGTMVVGRYRLHELLGQGGMGAVWRATDELLGRTVAIKQVRLDGLPPAEAALARERTMREARIAAALHHPHVVTVFDVVVDRGEPWLVMEYVPAPTLGTLLAERGELHPAEVATIGAQVAAALAAAHAAGIVHRDVKPDNILVTASAGGQPIVKLTDFGISHAATVPVLTATGVLTGTPAYFAPEVARGEDTDDRSDMYSLGATLYAAVDGHPPFGSGDGNLLGLLARISRGAPPPPRQAGLLTGLLHHLIADAPASRPTAVQAQHALQDMAGTMGPIAPTRMIATPRRPRRPLVLAAVGLVAAVAVVATVVVVGSGEPARPAAPPAAAAAPVAAAAGPLAAEHTADSCSLLDRQVLERFGSTTIDPDDARFRECVAFVGEFVAVHSALFNGPETQRAVSGWSPPVDGPRVLESDIGDDLCEHRVLHPDGSSVLISAGGATSLDDLCAIASAVAEAAAVRLVDPGIGRRDLPTGSVLAVHDACDLLTPEEVGRANGSATRSWPGFGGFSCQWGLPESVTSNVTLGYARRNPLDDGAGVPGEFGGKPGRTSHRPGQWCTVTVQQREYTDQFGSQRIEVLRVDVYGPGPTTCSHAAELATIAGSRLDAA